jgi:transcriptional regulator of arginine metabolism
LPEQVQAFPGSGLPSLLRDFVQSIDIAANLVVLKTPPGSAHLIGVALDNSALSEIVGTICGDDTIFIACASNDRAAELATKLRSESGKLQ